MTYNIRHAVIANLSYDIDGSHTGQTLSYSDGESFTVIEVFDDQM